MSGRDGGRGGRGGFNDRDGGRGSFRDRDGGGFRDRDRGPRPPSGSPSRPWERRDDERPPRPSGDRPFDRPFSPPQDRDVRVERYFPDEQPSRPPRDERGYGDRPARFGGDREGGGRDGGGRFTPPGRDTAGTRPAPRPEPGPERPPARPTAQRPFEPDFPPFIRQPVGGPFWTPGHLTDSWLEEERLKGWTPGDQELQEMVEDNIEADRQVPGRDRRAIGVQARGGTVTLTGTVRSREVKFAAGSDAYWTYGVNEVRNDLAVKPRGPQAAGDTTAPVAAAKPAAPPASPEVPAAAAEEAAPDEVDVVAPTTRRASRRKAASEPATEE